MRGTGGLLYRPPQSPWCEGDETRSLLKIWRDFSKKKKRYDQILENTNIGRKIKSAETRRGQPSPTLFRTSRFHTVPLAPVDGVQRRWLENASATKIDCTTGRPAGVVCAWCWRPPWRRRRRRRRPSSCNSPIIIWTWTGRRAVWSRDGHTTEERHTLAALYTRTLLLLRLLLLLLLRNAHWRYREGDIIIMFYDDDGGGTRRGLSRERKKICSR